MNAKKDIKENKDDVILIAETLLDKETITAEEIQKLLKNRTLEEKVAEPVKEAKEAGNAAENAEQSAEKVEENK